jgi:hypothetical protein
MWRSVDGGSAGDEAVGAAQVDRHAHQEQLGAVAVEAAIQLRLLVSTSPMSQKGSFLRQQAVALLTKRG